MSPARLGNGVSAFASALVCLAPAAHALTTERVATGLAYPVFVTAPKGDPRLFIVEQGGAIKILKDGAVLPARFLVVDSLTTHSYDERGLLGLAFAPDFAASGNFYIYYTDLSSDSVVRRYTVSANPDVADGATAKTILSVDQPLFYTNHKGGTIAFGPDGYLYLGLGDGGGSNDTDGNGQNGNTLLGKILRIDPTGDDFPADSLNNYSIPPTNPFVGNPSFRGEIWAYGVRNPYRWSFDRETGDLYIGDVGQACWEEIDFQAAGSPGGLNYGWNVVEGAHCFDASGPCDPGGCSLAPFTLPIREYDHTQDGFSCAVTGGCVYRGSAIPALHGTYFYADYCSAQIYSFRYDGATLTQLTNRTVELAPHAGLDISSPAAICEDGTGELYIVDRGPPNGEVYKIVRLHRRNAVLPEPHPFADGDATADATISLSPAFPNPSGHGTRFDLVVPAHTDLWVGVYEAAGRQVRPLFRGSVDAGTHPFEWDGRNVDGVPVSAGVYFVRVESSLGSAMSRVVRMP